MIKRKITRLHPASRAGISLWDPRGLTADDQLNFEYVPENKGGAHIHSIEACAFSLFSFFLSLLPQEFGRTGPNKTLASDARQRARALSRRPASLAKGAFRE